MPRDILETYLEKIDGIELIAKCDNAFEANDVLKKEDIDLMFLDINMPQLTGTDFLKGLADPPRHHLHHGLPQLRPRRLRTQRPSTTS